MKKLLTLSIAAALFGSASADTVQILCSPGAVPGVDEPPLLGLSISPNGRYVCGALEQGIGIFAADLTTGEVKWHVTLDDDTRDGDQLRAIDNDGVAVGYLADGVLFSYDTDEFTTLPAPEGFKYCIGEDITPDGSLIIGSLVGTGFLTDAAYSTDRVHWTLLPMPTEEQFGGLIDDSKGSAAKSVSVDGRVILGNIGSFGAPVIWVRNEAGVYEPDFYMARYVKATEADKNDSTKPLISMTGVYKYLSGNGRYVVGTALKPIDDDGSYKEVVYVYNTEEKSIVIYDDEQEIDEFGLGLYPMSIADDGTFVGTVGEIFVGSAGAFIMKAGESQAEFFVDAFPAFAAALGESDSLGTDNPTDITPDGRYILGYIYYSADYWDQSAPAFWETYVIDRGEDAAVGELSTQSAPKTIYSIDGRQLSQPQKGINIIRNSDGSVTKILKP